MREATRREHKKQQSPLPSGWTAPQAQPGAQTGQAQPQPLAVPSRTEPRKGSYLEIIGPHEKPLAVRDMEKREARRKKRLDRASRWYWEHKEWVRRRNAERTRYLRDMDKATKEAWDKLQKEHEDKAAGQPDGVSKLPDAAEDKPKKTG